MSHGGYTRREKTVCNRCKKDIVWDDDVMVDSILYSSVIDKLKKHQEEDKACLRIQKINEVLDEETDLLGCQKYL